MERDDNDAAPKPNPNPNPHGVEDGADASPKPRTKPTNVMLEAIKKKLVESRGAADGAAVLPPRPQAGMYLGGPYRGDNDMLRMHFGGPYFQQAPFPRNTFDQVEAERKKLREETTLNLLIDMLKNKENHQISQEEFRRWAQEKSLDHEEMLQKIRKGTSSRTEHEHYVVEEDDQDLVLKYYVGITDLCDRLERFFLTTKTKRLHISNLESWMRKRYKSERGQLVFTSLGLGGDDNWLKGFQRRLTNIRRPEYKIKLNGKKLMLEHRLDDSRVFRACIQTVTMLNENEEIDLKEWAEEKFEWRGQKNWERIRQLIERWWLQETPHYPRFGKAKTHFEIMNPGGEPDGPLRIRKLVCTRPPPTTLLPPPLPNSSSSVRPDVSKSPGFTPFQGQGHRLGKSW